MTALEQRPAETASAAEHSRASSVLRYAGIALALAVVAAPLVDGRGFFLSVGAHTLINAVMALSLTLVYGMGGLISLAQVGFGAVAAYLVILGTEQGYSFGLVLIVAVVVAVALALLLGLPVVRLSGVYFLTATFAFTELLRLVALNWTSVTGGQIGPLVTYDDLTRLPGAALLSGFAEPDAADYIVAVILFAVVAAIVWAYRQSRSGRNLMSLRDNETLATALGIRAVRERLMAFALGAAIAALGGVYLAYFNGIVDPTALSIARSIDVLIIVIIGGVYSIRGALVGSIVVTVIPELLQISVSLRPILYGALLVLFATRLRLGIVGELQRLIRRLSARRRRMARQPDTADVEVQP